MAIRAKICGLKTVEALKAAENSGAEFLGFIFHPKSARYITPEQAAEISRHATAKKVAVVVDADDETLDAIVKNLKPDYIQLHGNESEERAREIKARFNLPLIRAVAPNVYPDNTGFYEFLLVDAPGGGGKGIAFDWEKFNQPAGDYFLSGGLNPDNLSQAVKVTGARMVDVSSGVEISPGVKDLGKIQQFLELAKKL